VIIDLSVDIRKASVQSINQSIKTHFYSAICRERIRGASWLQKNQQCFAPPGARLLYQYWSKNVSGYRHHPRSVVAYSAEVAHRAVPMR